MSIVSSVLSWFTNNDETQHANDVVVYDPLNKILFYEDLQKLESKTYYLPCYRTLTVFPFIEETFVKLDMPGNDLKVTVYMNLPQLKATETIPGTGRNSTSGNTAKVYIATVNLEKLGSWVRKKRRNNEIQHLYVLGQIPSGFWPVQDDSEAF
ncbi:hypothetical protein EG328_004123 [Venturia inaequalis]|uniref:Uncharacterized protein n=1 Tax=Venturia inaequalis TaxID=5025 RepID=A0A8H3VFV5_VENIN|nr:hypothetical protein EG328_004123 [Venturia inaequalis]